MTQKIDPEFEFMMGCNKDRCQFFCDCYADKNFDWKKCFMVKDGGFINGCEEEKKIFWNAIRDVESRGTYAEEFKTKGV